MFPRIPVAALAALALLPSAGSSLAQSPAPAKSNQPPVTTVDDGDQTLQQKIQAKLTAEGFKDVHVKPTAFLVSAKDKDDKPVLILIGPNSMTVLHAPNNSNGATQGLGNQEKPTWE